MKLRPLPARILIGTIGLFGLAITAISIADGEFIYRGHTTSLANKPGAFWVQVGMFGALFAGFFLWAVSGAGFDHGPPEPPDGAP
ncbi:MAG: hypothetical protein F9K41_04990 [Sphingopyxis terrae]|uniref:hypothetical protein n=1 Tax=Sphingopyxis sp. TaxID=1908224 RepID=UPI0013F6DD77|nr:hypothetical protein [Sphingopyxis sp.]KAB2857006.1 MAG: hypothetical protein F9K41_04990 [Sphingopyxis terrae]